jgi:hypothetical protein
VVSNIVDVISSTAVATSLACALCSCAPAAISSVLALIWLAALAAACTAPVNSNINELNDVASAFIDSFMLLK